MHQNDTPPLSPSEQAAAWNRERVVLQGRPYNCDYRVVGRYIEVICGDARRVAPRGHVRLEVALRTTLKQALLKAA